MYSKEAGPPKHIVFYYEKQAMFDNVSLRTMYRAKNLLNEKGESQLDDYAMSADEMDAFVLFIRQAVYHAYDAVIKMTRGITSQPIFIDETIVISTIDKPNSYGFRIIDEEAYDDNKLIAVDEGIKEYLDNFIMASWYDLVGHTEEYAKWAAKRDDSKISLITKKLFALRKPNLS